MHYNHQIKNMYIDSDGASDYFGSQNTYLIRDKSSDKIVGGAIGNLKLTEKMKQLMFPTKGQLTEAFSASNSYEMAA